MKAEERDELVALIEEAQLGDFERRNRRAIAAEMSLGMWHEGKFVGNGLAELLNKARFGKPLSDDEVVVLNAGFTRRDLANGEPEKEIQRREARCAALKEKKP
jgi:hypothetical protein